MNVLLEWKCDLNVIVLCAKLADQFCNAIGVLQQCAPPASFSNIQTAINKDQPANPTEGDLCVFYFNLLISYRCCCCCFTSLSSHWTYIGSKQCGSHHWCTYSSNIDFLKKFKFKKWLNWWDIARSMITHHMLFLSHMPYLKHPSFI